MSGYPELLITKTKNVDEQSLFKQLPDLTHEKEKCGYTTPIPSTDPKQQALEQQVSQYIGRVVRVEVVDGRVYRGILYCYDCDGNIVLNHSERLDPQNEQAPATGTGVVMVMIQHIKKIQAKKQ